MMRPAWIALLLTVGGPVRDSLPCLLCGVLLSCWLASASRAARRETVDLDGVWSFATDPEDRGEREQWYRPGAKLPAMPLPGYAATADGTIRVPGIWDNQGYGTEIRDLDGRPLPPA
jgi:hypothetical protein